MSKHTHHNGQHHAKNAHAAHDAGGKADKVAASAGEGRGSVVVVGGNGGLSDKYRDVVAEKGLELRHFEQRIPNGTRHALGRVAAVIVMVGMVSHALRDQVKQLVPEGAPVVYLRSASISSLRNAVAALPTASDASSQSKKG